MQNTVYYSKKYINRNSSASPQAIDAPKAAPRKVSRMGVVMLIGCLAVAIAMVLFIPVLVDGAPPASGTVASAGKTQNIASFASPQEAAEFLSLGACLPAALPEDYSAVQCHVVDNAILEVEYSNGNSSIVFRAAAGSDDLSGQDFDAYAYTATEPAGDVARGYAGISNKKLQLAVWADGSHSYALLAQDGLEAAQMKQMAESIQP